MAYVDGIKYLCVALVFLAVYLLFTRPKQVSTIRTMSGWQKLQKRFQRNTSTSSPSVLPKQMQNKNIRLLSTLGGGLFGLILAGFDFYLPTTYLLIAVLAGAGYLAPRLILLVLDAQRKKALDLQLPDALELIANSLRAGLSLVQALEVVSKEAPRPIQEVFHDVHRDCRLGLSPEDSLEKLLKRWPNKDLELFIVAAGVSMRTGGNLAEVIGRIIGTVRERFRLKGRIAALTSQGKLSGWVVGLLPVLLLFVLSFMDPDLMGSFFRHPLGIAMLAGGLVMEIIGAFFIQKITEIDT